MVKKNQKGGNKSRGKNPRAIKSIRPVVCFAVLGDNQGKKKRVGHGNKKGQETKGGRPSEKQGESPNWEKSKEKKGANYVRNQKAGFSNENLLKSNTQKRRVKKGNKRGRKMKCCGGVGIE